MKLLEKENWWIWLMLAFLSGGTSIFALGALLDIYDKEAWYYRWTKKIPKPLLIVLIILFGIVALTSTFAFPHLSSFEINSLSPITATIISILSLLYMIIEITLLVFEIEIICEVNAKLKTPGSEIYLSPYIWILGLIIPIIGWIMIIVMLFYLHIWYLVMLSRGNGTNIGKQL